MHSNVFLSIFRKILLPHYPYRYLVIWQLNQLLLEVPLATLCDFSKNTRNNFLKSFR